MDKEKGNRKNFMEYRRFGKTNLNVSVINLGTMRYKHVWDKPADAIPKDTIEQCKTSVQLALGNGINLIETAHGYTKSEHCLGKVLNQELSIPRNNYYVMTKAHPASAEEARKIVDKQLKALKTDRLELYAWHGINNQELFIKSCRKQGPVEELLKMKEEGIIDNVGFSTHGPLEVICRAIETGLFNFVNLHYYYFFQRNYGAIVLAEARDMGVLIISPILLLLFNGMPVSV
jgi:predicted aldo/keto reductase-like oxidoreductase